MRPRRIDLLYLLCVGVLAVLFLGDVLTRAVDVEGPRSAPVAGAAGQPRDVDVDLLRELIRQGRLSDHEALHAHPVDGAGDPLPDPDDPEGR